MPIRTSSKGSKDNQDDGRDQERVGARPVVSQPAEEQLSDDGAGKGDVADIFLGSRLGVCRTILIAEHS